VVPGVEVINEVHNTRQTSLWVRAVDSTPPLPPGWEARGLSLEEVVVAYLANPNATAFPIPALEEAS
jgi:ABC-2 type transport system ATP-binding protein